MKHSFFLSLIHYYYYILRRFVGKQKKCLILSKFRLSEQLDCKTNTFFRSRNFILLYKANL